MRSIPGIDFDPLGGFVHEQKRHLVISSKVSLFLEHWVSSVTNILRQTLTHVFSSRILSSRVRRLVTPSPRSFVPLYVHLSTTCSFVFLFLCLYTFTCMGAFVFLLVCLLVYHTNMWLCPFVPLSQFSLSICSSVPLFLGPFVPLFLCFSVSLRYSVSAK